MTNQQISLLRTIAKAILESVRAAGSLGAPGGVMYAAMMEQGCTLNQFEQIMSGMVKAGWLVRDGDLYTEGAQSHKLMA